MSCGGKHEFKRFFDENMNALGLSVPSHLFVGYRSAISDALLLSEMFEKLGPGATMGELLGATSRIEKLYVLAGMGVAYYLGAVIGSIAVAAGRAGGCGARISDVALLINRNDIPFANWRSFYAMNPEILDAKHRFRFTYRGRAFTATERALPR